MGVFPFQPNVMNFDIIAVVEARHEKWLVETKPNAAKQSSREM